MWPAGCKALCNSIPKKGAFRPAVYHVAGRRGSLAVCFAVGRHRVTENLNNTNKLAGLAI